MLCSCCAKYLYSVWKHLVLCSYMSLGMQTAPLPSVAPTPASPGQAITAHQGKQLGMTKISLPCDCVPMFGAARA